VWAGGTGGPGSEGGPVRLEAGAGIGDQGGEVGLANKEQVEVWHFMPVMKK
jgi:hypothetical protein